MCSLSVLWTEENMEVLAERKTSYSPIFIGFENLLSSSSTFAHGTVIMHQSGEVLLYYNGFSIIGSVINFHAQIIMIQ